VRCMRICCGAARLPPEGPGRMHNAPKNASRDARRAALPAGPVPRRHTPQETPHHAPERDRHIPGNLRPHDAGA
jgi:hypothetical protein